MVDSLHRQRLWTVMDWAMTYLKSENSLRTCATVSQVAQWE